MKYQKLVDGIVENIGGLDNLAAAGHCATRLRFRLKDNSKLKADELEKVPGIFGVRANNVELQVIVGTDVLNVYQDFLDRTGFHGEVERPQQENEPAQKKYDIRNLPKDIMNYLSGTVGPIIPIYLGCGMLMAFLNICTVFLGLSPDSGTVKILNGAANAGFYFIPIAIGWCAASKLGADPAMGALLGMTMLYSSINGAEGLDFLGIPVYPSTYNGSFLPIMLGAAFLSFVYRFFKDKIPHSVRYFLLPLVTLLLAIPVTLCILGPAGYVIGTYLSIVFDFLAENFKIAAVALWAFTCPVDIMTGIDKAVYALNMNRMIEMGYDNIFLPGGLAANSAIGGAALAAWRVSRDTETRTLAMSSGITAILGITEPALYGICVKMKTPLLGAMTGAAVGGAFSAIVNLRQFAWAGPGLMTSPTYIAPGGEMANFFMCIATIAVSVIAGFATTFVLSKRQSQKGEADMTIDGSVSWPVKLSASAKGKILSMEEIPDNVFSQGLVGECCGIDPAEGKVYAPCDGVITLVPDTLHAIGLETVGGVEVLLHVGIDTVEMDGDGFVAKVEPGQKVRKGQLILEMDLDKIREAGHPAVVINAIANSSSFGDIRLLARGEVKPGEDMLQVGKKLD